MGFIFKEINPIVQIYGGGRELCNTLYKRPWGGAMGMRAMARVADGVFRNTDVRVQY